MIEAILNRLRGTGVIKHFGTLTVFNKSVEIEFVGNHLYGLYLALVLGIVTSDWLIGFAVFVAYLIGESSGWGKWLGLLVTPKEHRTIDLINEHQKDNEGRGYPFIHYIASFFISEKLVGSDKDRIDTQYWHSALALAIRGVYWWLPVYMVLAAFGYVSYICAFAVSVILGIGFPIAAYIGLKLNIKFKFGMLETSPGWENQELVYGFLQGICLWAVILFN